MRIRLRTTAGLKFPQTPIDRLCFYLAGRDDVANKLYELCLATGLGVLVLPAKGTPRWHEFLPARNIRPVGFADDEALLPVTLRSFQGYRLLQEYFSFPPRFRFFELTGLAPALQRAGTDEVELVLLFGRGDATLESVVDASNFALFCTPAINLFPKRADRIHVTDGAHEYHVVADRTRPLDFEVYEVTSVAGHGVGADSEQEFQPFYAAYSTDGTRQQPAYFTTRREPRLVTAEQRRRGSRSTYVGSEVFLSLVDPTQAPYSGDLRQLSLQVLCTNRDLPLQMPVGIGKTDLVLDMAAPVAGIRVVGAADAVRTAASRTAPWRGAPSVTCRPITCRSSSSTPQEGASALRDVLGLYTVGGRRQCAPADRGHQVGAPRARGAPAAFDGRVRSRSAAGSRSTSRSTSWRSRAAVPTRLDRCSTTTSRATSRSTRSRKPCCAPRRGARSIDGCRNGARGRRCDVSRGAGGGAVPPRFLPDAAQAGMPAPRQAALGLCPASGRRAGAARPGSRPRVCAGAAGVVRAGRRRRAAAARRSGCSGCSARTARCRRT